MTNPESFNAQPNSQEGSNSELLTTLSAPVSEYRSEIAKHDPGGAVEGVVAEDDILDAFSRREVASFPTGEAFWNGQEQRIDVAIVEPSPEALRRQKITSGLGSAAISGVRHRISLKPFTDEIRQAHGAQYFTSALQAASGEAVKDIEINSPGVKNPIWGSVKDFRKNRLSWQQAKVLKKGSFKETGHAQYNAYKAATNDERAPIDIYAASMGASSAAGFMRAAIEDGRGSDLGTVVLDRGTTFEKRRPGELFKNFMFKSGDAKAVLAGAPDIMRRNDEGTARWFLRLGASLLANGFYGFATAKGGFFEDLDLKKLKEEAPNIHVVIANGEADEVSRTAANDEAATRFAEAGIRTTRIKIEGGEHADAMSPTNAARLFEQAREAERDQAA